MLETEIITQVIHIKHQANQALDTQHIQVLLKHKKKMLVKVV